jgi:uncharacterized protein YjiS (DUF1127 family)
MNMLQHLARYLGTKRVEGEIHHELTRLNDRNLADIGLARGDIARFARAAARPAVPPVAGDARAGTGFLVGRALGLRAV